MGTRIAVWSLSGMKGDTWRVHSSLVLPENHFVTTIDCNAGESASEARRIDIHSDQGCLLWVADMGYPCIH